METHCSNTALKVKEECEIMEELQVNEYPPKKFIESTRKKIVVLKNTDRNYMEVVLEDGLVPEEQNCDTL